MRLGLGLVLSLTLVGPLAAEDRYRLVEALTVGAQHHVSSRVELSGSLTVASPDKDKPSQQLSVVGSSVIEYDERVLDTDSKGVVTKTLRQYVHLDYQRKVGDQPQASALRPEVRRLVVLREKLQEVPFSPDGPLTWGEIDLVRTDVFTPALRGLLPDREVRIGDRWPAGTDAVQELTDLDPVTAGSLECRLQEIVSRNGRRYAQVTVSGTVTGTNEDGPNRQQIDGYYFFDLQSQHLSYLYANGTSWMLNKNGDVLGKIEGKYILTRRQEASPALADAVVKALDTEPRTENTLMLFNEPSMGVRFVYPRRWTVRKADARQIVLDTPGGSGLVVTLEPLSQLPTGAEFQQEAAAQLRMVGGVAKRATPAAALSPPLPGAEHFEIEADINRQPVFLDYYVYRQAPGGATFAGRYVGNEVKALQKEVEGLVRSLKLIPPPKGGM
jgi:hypothetical protein